MKVFCLLQMLRALRVLKWHPQFTWLKIIYLKINSSKTTININFFKTTINIIFFTKMIYSFQYPLKLWKTPHEYFKRLQFNSGQFKIRLQRLSMIKLSSIIWYTISSPRCLYLLQFYILSLFDNFSFYSPKFCWLSGCKISARNSAYA